MGPYRILEERGQDSFKIDLPSMLKRRGVHPVFHAKLLRIHVPNDNRLFPGRTEAQIGNPAAWGREWAIERVVGHAGCGSSSILRVLWKAGDES
ncbi:hypothetical protein FISHEDRAFT_34854 [Fistulina hepatica ATCC 64428]|uniref:Tf2-1-like SH3-like domain-containing protein n=1 Tax=Fistulina hepatica ATCC 64428 TaxID=1128425 RepID=A0A0D7AL91_9AGAR|nr:hypothetical protein FISHEDRAFT_34854 [Fistulina hepatica ATCC 64428]